MFWQLLLYVLNYFWNLVLFLDILFYVIDQFSSQSQYHFAFKTVVSLCTFKSCRVSSLLLLFFLQIFMAITACLWLLEISFSILSPTKIINLCSETFHSWYRRIEFCILDVFISGHCFLLFFPSLLLCLVADSFNTHSVKRIPVMIY